MEQRMVNRVISCMMGMQRYSWEQGFCAQALYELGREDLWIPMAYDAIRRSRLDGRLAMGMDEVSVSDPAANGEVCLRAYECTGERIYKEAAERMLYYLQFRAPRTRDGVICHNTISFEEEYSAKQLWIDGIYMVPPFLAVMGELEEAAHQVEGYWRSLFDPDTNVFRHIVDTENQVYVDSKRWATGNGWALMGLIRVAEEANRQGNTQIQADMLGHFRQLLGGMLKYQIMDGRFHDILDEQETFADGTSALMAASAIYRAYSSGYLGAEYLECANQVMETMTQLVDSIGLVHGVCGSPRFDSEGTSAEAQAAFVSASAWQEKVRNKEQPSQKEAGKP